MANGGQHKPKTKPKGQTTVKQTSTKPKPAGK
jgi:hypothetical protein